MLQVTRVFKKVLQQIPVATLDGNLQNVPPSINVPLITVVKMKIGDASPKELTSF